MASSRCCRVHSKHFIGIPTMIVLMFIIGYVYYIFIMSICAGLYDLLQPVAIFYGVVFHILLLFVLGSYFRTVFTDPGKVPPEFSADNEDAQRLRGEAPSGVRRFCERCNTYKPDRCHHCSICDRCILKMDHHCPWMNNCIGFYNYKYFLLFLIYTSVACVIVALASLHYILIKPPDVAPGMPMSKQSLAEIACVILMAAIGIFLMFFGGHHTRMTLANVTTLESFTMRESTYNIGSRKNWESVFGTNPWKWWNPFAFGVAPLGDGTHFATWEEMEDVEEESYP